MEIGEFLKDYIKFNYWANARIIEWLKSNPIALMDKKGKSSFPTIGQTLSHILAGQTVYLSLLKNIPFRRLKHNSAIELFDIFLNQSKEFQAWVEKMKETDFQETRQMNGSMIKGVFPCYQLIFQALNHSMYHRGQIITLGYQLDLSKPPATDYLYYKMINLKTT
jgi:uncharacterized damage-inducible protein DinB